MGKFMNGLGRRPPETPPLTRSLPCTSTNTADYPPTPASPNPRPTSTFTPIRHQ